MESSKTPLGPRHVPQDQGPDPQDADDDDDRAEVSETEALLSETFMSGPQDQSQPKMASLPVHVGGQEHERQSSVEVGLALESLVGSEHDDNAHLRAQGHEAALERRFSPLAALGLGFR